MTSSGDATKDGAGFLTRLAKLQGGLDGEAAAAPPCPVLADKRLCAGCGDLQTKPGKRSSQKIERSAPGSALARATNAGENWRRMEFFG